MGMVPIGTVFFLSGKSVRWHIGFLFMFSPDLLGSEMQIFFYYFSRKDTGWSLKIIRVVGQMYSFILLSKYCSICLPYGVMNRWGWACGNVCSQFREVVASNVSFCTGEYYLDSGILQENSVFYSICILNIHNNSFFVCLDVQLEKSPLKNFIIL